MLNIIFYDNNTLKIEEEIKDEGETLIVPLQSIIIKENDGAIGYHKHPGESELVIRFDNLNYLKNGLENILLKIEEIRMTPIIEIDNNHLSIYFNNINQQLVNSIRRILLSEIETIAFDKIEIIENETFMPDEVWKKRIESIPMKIKGDINLNDNNYFELNKKFNKNSENYVTSNDLTNIHNNKIELIYNDIIIYKLKLNQRIKIRAFYKKGINSETTHDKKKNENYNKWSSVIKIPLKIFWEFYIKKEDINKILPFYISYNISIREEINGIFVIIWNEKCKEILKRINDKQKINDNIVYFEKTQLEILSLGKYNSKVLFYKSLDILKLKYIDFLNKICKLD